MNRKSEVKEQRKYTHHGNQDITNSFNGRLVSFAAAFTSVLKRPWQDLQHVGQIEWRAD